MNFEESTLGNLIRMIDVQQLESNYERILGVMNNEIKILNGDSTRLSIGGFS
jgi:hypothetical protein